MGHMGSYSNKPKAIFYLLKGDYSTGKSSMIIKLLGFIWNLLKERGPTAGSYIGIMDSSQGHATQHELCHVTLRGPKELPKTC